MVASIHFFVANETQEAFQMVDVVLSSSHNICWWNTFPTRRTLGSKMPIEKVFAYLFIYKHIYHYGIKIIFLGIILNTFLLNDN